MRPKITLAVIVSALGALLFAPTGAVGKEPPNQNDPCSTAGRNTCGTNGVGQHAVYRYGIRWFGDFRRVVPNTGPMFCIDLRWWYPAARYRFREIDVAGLKNSNGQAISVANQQRMAYALWTYGRSNSRDQQSAVMLYVHSLMADGAPGEVDPSAVNSRVVTLFRTISRDSTRFRGPYTVQTRLPSGLTVGKTATATIRVVSVTGNAVPNVGLTLAATGATGVPVTIRTNRAGLARVTFTPNDATAGVTLKVNTGALASTLPRIFKATTPGAARNGQRMATSALQRLSDAVAAPVAKGAVGVTSTATPATMLVGEANTDTVKITGAPKGWDKSATVNLYGPFASQAAVACTGTPVATSTFPVDKGSTTYTTSPFTPTQVGWYGYQIIVPDDPNITGVTSPCPEPTETFKVEIQPRLSSAVSKATFRKTDPDPTLSDKVTVGNLAGLVDPGTGAPGSVMVTGKLFGPFPTRAAIACTGAPLRTYTNTATAAANVYDTPAETLTAPGFYTYVEEIAAGEFVRAAQITCGDVAETSVLVAQPAVTTVVSNQATSPGAQIHDTLTVTGLGTVPATVQVELWGPYESAAAISCTGTPFATQTLTVNGDGVYQTDPITIDRAGVFSYRESLAGSEANDVATTACGEAAETTVSTPAPTITTQAASEVLLPGGALRDRVFVGGLGKTPGTVSLQLYGPFATRAAIGCTGTPVGTTQFDVPGDGTYLSPGIKTRGAGFYMFRERLSGSGFDITGPCTSAAESALGRPLILTGQGDPSGGAVSFGLTGRQPARVQISALGVNARVASVGIDTSQGILNVPIDIQRLGWWRDGATPGDRAGSVLIAGHVDSARRGGGAFVRLKNARAGMRVRVTSANGQVRTYRVTRVQRVLKANLPTNVFSTRGARRLTLVTCGGPFLREQGHYRDNIIVTAVPV